MVNVLLSTTYFGPIQWYQMLCRADHAKLECCECFQKQTYRNRCIIATANGPQSLSVPIDHTPLTIYHSTAQTPAAANNGQCSARPLGDACYQRDTRMFNVQCIKDIRLSDHGEWRRQHWNALTSAYGESPFFDYYQDDLRPFFECRRWTYLLDFNEAIREVICQLLDIHPNLSRTLTYSRDVEDGWMDCRSAISPKHPNTLNSVEIRPYYQVYQHRNGFLPNLSILDLLFNMGPEGIFWLV